MQMEPPHAEFSCESIAAGRPGPRTCSGLIDLVNGGGDLDVFDQTLIPPDVVECP